MNILIVAPFSLPVPPFEGYGGTQRAIYDIIVRLAPTDSVTLFAPAGSRQVGRTRLYTYPSREEPVCEAAVIEHLKDNVYDLVYVHTSTPPFAERVREHCAVVVVASHYYFEPYRLEAFARIDCWLQAQSESQAAYTRRYAPRVISVKQSVAVDGIEPSLRSLRTAVEEPTLPVLQDLRARDTDYLLILSRISDYKGQDTAVKLAGAAGLPLVIAGEPVMREEGDHDYFERVIKPQVDGHQTVYFGNANETQKLELMRYAKATLLPTGFENRKWHEAFGRVVNESLACGTPVVAHDWDAMPEQITHGQNGFLFRTFDQALESIRNVGSIDRQACVDSTTTDLNADRFVRDLRAAFSALLS